MGNKAVDASPECQGVLDLFVFFPLFYFILLLIDIRITMRDEVVSENPFMLKHYPNRYKKCVLKLSMLLC